MLTGPLDLLRSLAVARIGLGLVTLLNTWEMHGTLSRIIRLCFTACDRVWALRPQPEGRTSTWVPTLMMTQVCVCYLFASLSKINTVFLHGSIVVLMNHDNVVLLAFTLTCVSLYPLFFVRRVGGAVRGSSGQECLG